MTRDPARVDPRLQSVCRSCGTRFTRDLRRIGRPLSRCPVCRDQDEPGDITKEEIDRRFNRALRRARAAGRFQIHEGDCYRNCSMAQVVDRGPDTEAGVKLTEAW